MSQKPSYCPYCYKKFDKKSMHLFFAERDPTVGRIMEQGLDGTGIELHKREDNYYEEYWKGYMQVENTVGAQGMVVDVAKVRERMANTHLRFNFEMTLDEEEPKNSMVSLPRMHPARPRAFLCPECWNFFPLNYFDHDNYTILLVGHSQVGKTDYVVSLLANNARHLTGNIIDENAESLVVQNNQIKYDPAQVEFWDSLREFENTYTLPKETKRPMPPVFLTLTWEYPNPDKPGEKTTYTCNVEIVDTEGERWKTNASDSSIPTAFLDSCGGILYFTEPLQTKKELNVINRGERRVGGVDYEWDPQPPVMNARPERGNLVNAGRIYLDYFAIADTEIKKNTPIAFVLNKFDELQTLYALRPEDCPPFYAHLTSLEPSSDREVLLDFDAMAIHNIASHRLFDKLFKDLPTNGKTPFTTYNWFCSSSFSGTPKRVPEENGNTECLQITEEAYQNAYHIHMPILWLLSEIMKNKDNSDEEANEVPQQAAPSASRTQQAPPSASRTQQAPPSADRTQQATPSADRTRQAAPSADRTQKETPSASRTQQAAPSASRTQTDTTPEQKDAGMKSYINYMSEIARQMDDE